MHALHQGCISTTKASPGGGGGGVAEAVEGVLGGLALRGRQAQLLLHLINDRATASVQQEVLKGMVEFGDVALVQDHLHLHTVHMPCQTLTPNYAPHYRTL
jgi:hypothetical protein